MTRTAAAIWASIGAFGLIGTIDPLRDGVAHVSAMQSLACASAAIAAMLLLAPARLVGERLLLVLPAFMTVAIGALAYAGGDERGDLTILLTFVVVFAAYFQPWRLSVFHLGLAVALLVVRLFTVDADLTKIETIRFSILLPALVSVWGLVSILKNGVHEREARLRIQEVYEPETGLLSENGLSRALDPELARAMRHARPLSLILLEVSGPDFDHGDGEATGRVATAIARSIIGRIRAEDRAARIGPLRFAVLASETAESGASVLARALAEQVRKRLLSVGYEGTSLCVAIGWSDYQQTSGSKQALLADAEQALSEAIPSGDGIAVPLRSQPPPPPPPQPVSDLEPAR
jgi:diguanylate cyclase (GGDEF)-like protein